MASQDLEHRFIHWTRTGVDILDKNPEEEVMFVMDCQPHVSRWPQYHSSVQFNSSKDWDLS